MNLDATKAKLQLHSNSDSKLAEGVERLKISLEEQEVDHKEAQNKLKAQCRELQRTKSEIKTRSKSVSGKGFKDTNGLTELS